MKLAIQIFLSIFLFGPSIVGLTFSMHGGNQVFSDLSILWGAIVISYIGIIAFWPLMLPLWIYSVLLASAAYRLNSYYKERVLILGLANILASTAIGFVVYALAFFIILGPEQGNLKIVVHVVLPSSIVCGVLSFLLTFTYNKLNQPGTPKDGAPV